MAIRVDIERIREIVEERRRINTADLRDIEFYEGGVKVDIPAEYIDRFSITGLSNVDFIALGFYEGRSEGVTQIFCTKGDS